MRVFIAGATGALGRALVPRLVAGGHSVVGLARSAERGRQLESIGAAATIADPLERRALIQAVCDAEPEVIVHQLTALTHVSGNFRKFDQDFTLTNRFRTEVTDILLEACRIVGAHQFIAQSFCGWPFARSGGMVKSEKDPLDPDPPAGLRETLAAIIYLEKRIAEAEGVRACALRYGLFYGPGTGIATQGALAQLVRKRKVPIVGRGTGVWSFIHIEDAAEATVAAVAERAIGTYNIVDDEPAPVSEWLPYLARALGAKPPRRVPAWLARLLIGDVGIAMMTEIRGGSNAKAKRELGWQLNYPSWRVGFSQGLD